MTLGKVIASTAKAMKPSGTLMKKIHCHDRWVVMKPPSSGPATLAAPKMAMNRPVYRPR